MTVRPIFISCQFSFNFSAKKIKNKSTFQPLKYRLDLHLALFSHTLITRTHSMLVKSYNSRQPFVSKSFSTSNITFCISACFYLLQIYNFIF